MPTELPQILFRYSYLDFASHIRYSFTVGVTQMMFLEIENQANRNVEKIILESLSDGEKERLKEMLVKRRQRAFKITGLTWRCSGLVLA